MGLAQAAADLVSLSPSVFLNLGGWVVVGASVIVSISRGWLVPGPQHRDQLAQRDKAYAEMVAIKDKAFEDALTVRREQLEDIRKEKDDWRTTAAASDTRADVLAANQSELMDGVRTAVSFIDAVHRATGGAG